MEDLADIVFKNPPFKEAWTKKADEIENKITKNCPANQFYLEMRPLLFGLRLCSRLPYTVSSDGKLRTQRRIFCVLWALLYCMETLVALKNLIGVITLIKTEVEIFKLSVYSINLVVLLFHFYSPVTTFLECSKICDYMNKWQEFEDDFALVIGSKFTPRYKNIMIILLMTSSVIVAGLVFLERNVFFWEEWYHLCVYGYLIANSGLYLLFWVFSFMEISHAGIAIKLKIIEVVKEKNVGCTPSDVYSLRKLWCSLSTLIYTFGDSIGLSVLLMLLICDICFVVSSFALISSLLRNPSEASQFLAFVVVLTILKLLIAETSHRVVDKVGKEISDTLINLDTRHFSEETMRELDVFGRAVSVNYPVVSLKGFTNINRATVTSMFGTTVTYLIVLVQFQST